MKRFSSFITILVFFFAVAVPVSAAFDAKSVRGYFVIEKGAKNAPVWYVYAKTKKRYCIQSDCKLKKGQNKAPCFSVNASLANMRGIAKKYTKKQLVRIPIGLDCKKPAPKPKIPDPPALESIDTKMCEQVRIQWSDVTTAEAYQIFRDNIALATVFYNQHEFVDAGITGQHVYKIRAVNQNGASDFSSEEGILATQCTPPPPPPPTPKIPNAPSGTSIYIGSTCNEIMFRWFAVADADRYEIFRDRTLFAQVSAGITSYSTMNVPKGAQYAYQVRAVNGAGPSVLTQEKISPAVTCGAPPPPTQPTQRIPNIPQRVRATAIACTKVYMQWDDVANEDGYEILRNGQVIEKTTTNTSGFTDMQAQEGTTYTYAVRAFNGAGASASVTGVTVVTPACPGSPPPIVQGQPPQAPVFDQVTQIDCRTFLIRWFDVAGEDGYSLIRDGVVLQQTKSDVTTYTDTGLSPALQYRYSIRAFNRFGDSPSSTPLVFKTGTCANVQPPPPPPPPRVVGTTANCAQAGGTTCARGEACVSRWLDVQGDNRCCATACQKYQVAQRCNYNSICEPQEIDACSDCQCRGGIVCGGVCYSGLADDADCVNGTLVHKNTKPQRGFVYCADTAQCPRPAACLLPGPCDSLSMTPIHVTLQLPTQLEVGVWTPGTMTIANTGTTVLSNHIYFELSGIDIEIALTPNSTPVPLPSDWDLVQFQPNVPRTYAIRARLNTLSDSVTPQHQVQHATVDLRFSRGQPSGLTRSFYGYTSATATSCGAYRWNISGKCLENIWYAGANCQSGQNCIGRIDDWGMIPRTYPAKGTYAVLIMTAGLTAQQQADYSAQRLLGFGQEVGAFFRREAERIVGQPMVDFTFTFDAHYSWTIPDPQLQFLQGQQTVREYIESKIGRPLSQQQYPFILIAVPKIPGPQGYSYSEAGGLYHVGQGVILVKAAHGILQPQVIAHEFTHAFGCQDWYNGSGRANRFYLCNERRANNLLCAAETVLPELQWFERIREGYTTLMNRRLDDCAAEMGWGDLDGDGKVDLDPSITL